MKNQKLSVHSAENHHAEETDAHFFTTFMNQNDGFLPLSLSPDPDDDGQGKPKIPPPVMPWLDDFTFSHQRAIRL